MRRKTMRIILAVICVMIAGSIMSSCGDVNEKDKTVTLTWYVPGEPQKETALVMEEVNKIIEPEIGAKLDLQFIEQSSYEERIRMMIASQTEFDMMLTGYVNNFDNVVQKNGFLPLTDSLKKNAPKLYEQMPAAGWSAATYDGEIYAVPNQQIWANYMGIGFRKDLVEKYGYNTDNFKTIDDAEEFWNLVLKNDPDLIPLWLSVSDDLWTLDKYENIISGISYDREAKKAVITAFQDDAKEAAYKKREWYKKGYLRRDIATVSNQNADFVAGRFASMLCVCKPGIEMAKKMESGGQDWIIVPFSTPYVYRSKINATMTAVSASSKNLEKSVKFLELINTNKDLYRLIAHGIEGKHYNKVGDNTISYIDGSGYAPKADWKFGNSFNAYELEGDTPNVIEKIKKINETAEVSPLMQFSFVSDNVVTEISQVSAVNNKYSRVFSGVQDPDEYWEQYINELKVAEVEKILDEVNRQLDEFNNKK